MQYVLRNNRTNQILNINGTELPLIFDGINNIATEARLYHTNINLFEYSIVNTKTIDFETGAGYDI